MLMFHCTISQGPGLSAYLEDIESDEGDLLMVDEDEKPPGTPLPETTSPTPPTPSGGSSGQPSKEQLLQKMDTVDRDIAATEDQISALQKRQVRIPWPLAAHVQTLSYQEPFAVLWRRTFTIIRAPIPVGISLQWVQAD